MRQCNALASHCQSGCCACQRAHNNLAVLAVAERSTHAVRVRLAADLKRGWSDL